MESKLAKGNFLLLGTLALSNVFVYFQEKSLSNHIFKITNESHLNSFLFFANSFLVLTSYYLGAFVVVAFAIYAIVYSKFLKFKFKGSYELVIISSIFLLSILCYLFYPQYLGKGLASIYSEKLDAIDVAFLFFFSFVFTLWGLCGWSFKTLYVIAGEKSDLALAKIKQLSIWLKTEYGKVKDKVKDPGQKVFNKVSDSLSGQRETIIQRVIKEEVEEPEYEEVITEEDFYFPEVLEEKEKINKKVKTQNKIATKSNYLSQEDLIESLENKERKVSLGPDQKYFETITQRLEEKLEEFKVQAKVINVIKGPVVDTFELELGPGVKVSKVKGITEDLSLALSGAPIRMTYPLKGKTTMGIEVPRNPREIIYLDDVLRSSGFKKADHSLPIAIGKNSFGETTVVDLSKMPHMLVAGATGAGKSVFINTLLVSLLVKLDPSKLKLILIDPKQLELALYTRLPHLLLPVMTDAQSASIALLWACQEMERRYNIMREMGVRNLESFNKKLSRANRDDIDRISAYYDANDEQLNLPYIVIIVDEFADLILSKVGKDIETNICRLAAKARASGIHLVVATQRPSVDVITGLIKSNFPTRVSFRVTSPVDSRTILNNMGAEKLLGKGDMLYKHGIEMERLHGAYIEESEIENLIENMCKDEPEFSLDALNFIEQAEQGDLNFDHDGVSIQQTLPEVEGKDSLYQEALNIVRETKAASASLLQRRLRIGYNRAANLVEQMERDGVVGPANGSKPRDVLI